MNIQLSDHFTYRRLFKFVLPSIGMMVFTSIYGIVDGFFVSNFAGKTAFAAVNLIMPFLMILSSLGFMFGTGGCALVSKNLGEDGVSAFGVMMYVGMIFYSVFMGYAVGTAPIISYNYGAENYDEKRNVFRKSLVITAVFSVAMVAASLLLAAPMSKLYVGYDETLFELTVSGFRIFSFSFLFAGTAIYSSSFFTALNNGLVSAVISFLRMLVFPAICVFILPLIWGINGIWIALVAAEFISAVVDAGVLIKFKGKYRY